MTMQYSISNCIKSKFSRVVQLDEDIEDVSEEIEYLLSPVLILDQENLKNTCKDYVHQFLLKSKELFNIAKKLVRQLEDIVLCDTCITNYDEKMSTVLSILEAFRIFVRMNKGKVSKKEFNYFKHSITKFTDFPENLQIKFIANSNNKQDNGLSSYFHFYLEVLWLFATINMENENTNDLLESLESSMTQLIFINFKQYERNKNSFVLCKCFQTIWAKIQIFCDGLKSQKFWLIINSILGSYPEEFCLDFINFQAHLQCYNSKGQYEGTSSGRIKENLEFFNEKWNLFLKNAQEEKICENLIKVEYLITELWIDHAKLDFLYASWDYFYKKLEIIKHTERIQQVFKSVDTCNNCGYLVFLRMLKKHLKRHPQHWNRFKGRIYTRFPPTKFSKLSEQGIENLLLIFFTISFVNFDEIIGKILDYLNSLPKNQQNNKTVWNIYANLFQECLNNNRSIEKVTEKFVGIIQETSSNRSQFHLIEQFVKDLQGFFSASDLTLKQTVLLGSWMENYLKSCEHFDLLSFLNVLAFIIRRIIDAGIWYEYQQNFVTFLLPTLKNMQGDLEIIGTVAALIIAHTSYQGFNHRPWIDGFSTDTGPKTVAFFTSLANNSTVININSPEIVNVFVRTWFQCWIVGVCNTEFTVATFELLGMEIVNNEGPFELFLSKATKAQIANCCFNLERHLIKNQTLQTFANMSLVFNYCGLLLYNQCNSNCRLSKFVDLLLLPLDVLRGNKPAFLSSIEKTWHLFVISINKICDSDPYLERVLKDLIVKYLPLFSAHPHPITKILNYDEKLTRFTYGKISLEYFQYGVSRCTNDEHLAKVLTCMLTLIDDLDESQLKMFCECLLCGLFEVYLFKNHKVVVIAILKKLCAKEYLKTQIGNGLLEITKRHLALNAVNYFQLIFVLTKIVNDVVKGLLPKLKAEIHLVECKRGQGFDNHLRQSYDKLKKLCS